MSVLKIIIAPNPLLQMVSQPIDKITNEIQTLAHNMLDTMYAKDGIGLSAVQVGILKRIIVVDVEWPSLPKGQYGTQHIMINPEVIHVEELNECKEGCLSFPDEFVKITRPKAIKVKYQDLNGTTHQIQADGLLSTCIQHEIDHLNGKTISSYISHQKKIMMFNRLKKKWQ